MENPFKDSKSKTKSLGFTRKLSVQYHSDIKAKSEELISDTLDKMSKIMLNQLQK
jgi:hypothetical protein